jgi:tRNA threonylcarbamoyladenosine biosynthesis protein TsaE
VLLLDGDLGAGKTTFTQGLARAMGVGEVVTSPTFSLVRSYPTAFGVELIHVDVYRLETQAEIVALGLPEMLEDGAVAVVEWGQRAGPALSPDHLGVRLELTDIDGERRVGLTPVGPRWHVRWDDLVAAAGLAVSP